MPKLTHKLPRKYWVAVSGGVDSMSFLHFLNKPSRKDALLGVIYVNHLTDFGSEALLFVRRYCNEHNICFNTHNIDGRFYEGQSKECFWRDERYKIFNMYNDYIILGHHLDDCLEEYVMCTMVRGFLGTIPYRHGNCIRPFRLWKRKDIKKYAVENNVPYIEDPSNVDTKYKRNKIRRDLIPRVLEINPGVYRLVARVIEKQDERTIGGI